MSEKTNGLAIARATAQEDKIIARHFYQLWLDNNIESDSIDNRWCEKTVEFIAKARTELSFQAFIAQIEAEIVGSVSCQLYAGLYPFPFKSDFRHYGYIWNVFVEANYRDRGIGTQLTAKAIEYLRSVGCTHALLHASPYGKPVYEKLGFVPKNEMILEL